MWKNINQELVLKYWCCCWRKSELSCKGRTQHLVNNLEFTCAVRYYLDSTGWLQSSGTRRVEGVGSKRMSVKQNSHRFGLENTGTDVRAAALKFPGLFSPGRSYHSDLVSYSCLTSEFPLGIQFSFLFGFSCPSTHCLPQPRYLFLNQQVPSLYTFALGKWKHTEWVRSLFKSRWRPKGHHGNQSAWKVYFHLFGTRIPSHLPHLRSMLGTFSLNRKFNVTNHYIFHYCKDRWLYGKETFPFSR